MKYLLCFLLGGLYTLSFTPYNISVLSIISIILLFLLLDLDKLKESVIKVFLFSFSYFSIGTYWLDNVISSYSDTNAILEIFIIIFFILYLSLYIVTPVLICSLLKRELSLNKNFTLIILSILISLFEILRSYMFTGFSWNNFGQSALNTIFIDFFPVIGVHGVSFMIFLTSLIIINIIKINDFKFFIFLTIVSFASYGLVKDKNWTLAKNEIINVSIIQPNTVNKLSYNKKEINLRMNQLYKLSLESLSLDPDIILWPESPIPIPYNDLKDNYYDKILSILDDKTHLVAGTFYKIDKKIFNSLISISEPHNVYHKNHLVPFGEYLPYRKYLNTFYSSIGLSVYDLAKGSYMSAFLVNKYIAQPLICYESIFSQSSLIINADVDFIINVSNDGWFGNSLAPYQHLDALRMRSLENQRYSIRSANNGISAVISPKGDIIKNIEYEKEGILNANIKPRNGHTPLSKYGYDILYVIMFILFLVSAIYYNLRVFRR